MARDILAIPGAEVSVERIFSTGRAMIPYQRNALSSETVNELMMLRCNKSLLKEKGYKISLVDDDATSSITSQGDTDIVDGTLTSSQSTVMTSLLDSDYETEHSCHRYAPFELQEVAQDPFFEIDDDNI